MPLAFAAHGDLVKYFVAKHTRLRGLENNIKLKYFREIVK